MDFLELAKSRYSVRKFTDVALSEEAVEKIVQAGILAPTAANFQPQRIFVVRSEDGLAKLRKSTSCDFGTKTSFLICYDRTESWKRKFDGADSGEIDVGIVATHMMLEAASIGVGSTWVMWFDPAITRREFELPENIIPVAMLIMGYPAEDAEPADNHFKRKPAKEIVTEL